MDTGPEICICPDVSVIVPVKPGWNVIVAGPGAWLALTTASRRLPAPLSFRLVTVNVVAGVPGGLYSMM